MHRNLSKRKRITATFILMLLATTLIASLLPKATATPSPVKIDSIAPTSGPVGTTVRVIGEIDTTNGSYRILFDGAEVKNGTLVGTAVNDTFRVPLSVKGNYNVTLYDVTNDNQSLPVAFNVTPSYYVSAEPAIIQEGLNTTITVSVNGAEANTTYTLTINVTDPTFAHYNATLVVSTNSTGSGSNYTLYYDDFSAGAHTNYVGTYTIAVNETLTTGNFTVGLTDKLEYRRIDNVLIRGSGYNATESVAVDIATSGVSVIGYPKNVTASTYGVVTHVWSIPDNVTLGNYTVTLTNATSPGTVKPIPDIQNFSIAFMERILIDPPCACGGWGTPVRVIGEIFTFGGQYRILWDNESVKEGNCGLNSGVVNDTFTVPPSVKGYHNITLYDVNQTTESMLATFEVTTSCYVLAEPTRILEGLSPTITVGVHEAEANANYTFTINVTDPLNRTWTKNRLVTTYENGSGRSSTKYPGGFINNTAEADTDYLGNYSITVNATLANGGFTVGLTEELEYRRTKRVIIQGSGYEEEENVTVDITFAETGETVFSENRSAIDGIVAYLWIIPENATLGIYTITLTNTYKPIPDIQNFTVIEIIVYCQARNKYNIKELLIDVTIDATYPDGERARSGKTNKTGSVDFRLDRGNYTFKALWKGETVGILENQSVTGEAKYLLQKRFNITCELAHITIAISDEADPPNPLPLINVTLTSDKTGILQFETDYTGIIATNTFTNTSYTIETRRHGYLFNRTSIENLTVTRWINITCPTYTLFAHVLDSQRLPLKNVQVVVYEWGSGVAKPVKSGTTNDLGSVALDCMFGKYKIWVYNQNRTIILNKTVVNLIKDRLFLMIYCKIVNVDLSVMVKDYFGSPISNALVKIERENVDILPQKTGSNGKTSFENIIGGEVRISVSVNGKLCETRTIYLDETKVVVFKLDRYVTVAGYLLETTQFIACISLGMLVAFFALALIYRRFRTRKVSEGKEKSL